MSTHATVEPTSSKAPILTQGDVSPAVMMDFENAALDFFVSKSIPADKQVTMVIPGIKDLHIHDWITADRTCIVAPPFADFMAKMHMNYLPPDWEDLVHNEILTSMLANSKTTFWNWSQQLLRLNCLLQGTSSALDDTGLRNHLEAHLNDNLKAKVRHSEARKDKNFKSWVMAVRFLDEACAVEMKHQCELIEETILQHQAKRQNTNNDTLHGPSCCTNTTQNNTSSSASSSTYVQLPALTDDKCVLLNDHKGCTKCCKLYMDHRSQNCPDSFPPGKGYKTLTNTDVTIAKKAKVTAKSIKKAVTTTTTTIEPVDPDDKVSAAAAILPKSPSEYNSDSDEDWDVSHCEGKPMH
ncbi:uncharacterized protein LACBIDRAFT_325132 [Laccaria bicolor S238N-H82]|uniref:Predicted protein n=1 Tax=Laccaria bicolor (strain S238N-H82 / ATCC MYA-4686) TaxID=486041 RepID=B0D5A1_LACBS|nr:uncharacterized protein LACBIDRAFT_325132 [Laccaria bicolor S238N-H82]EDR10484.1 predicted protein [Laccaria bicolor S238N-H82]|eukprot:XP_001878934.1 predicted protein [Laccaria bicolor S238N-H82]